MRINAIALLGMLAVATAAGAQQSDEQCKKEVDATVQSLELHTKQTGTEQKLRGLSVDQIRKVQATDGNCAALREINKRKMHS